MKPRHGRRWLAVLMGATLLAAPAPALAQVMGNAPYVPAPDPVLSRMQSRIDSLEADLQRATGRSEQLAFELSQAKRSAEEANAGRTRLEQALAQVTTRLETLERMVVGDTGVAPAPLATGGGPSVPSGQPGSGPIVLGPDGQSAAGSGATALPEDEDALIKQARLLLLNGDFPAAQAASDAYLKKFPKGPNASEAQFVLSEAYLYQEAYSEAAAGYGKLLSSYSKSARAPEGLVKLARSMRLMGQKEQACKALGLMGKQFPKASKKDLMLADAERARAGC